LTSLPENLGKLVNLKYLFLKNTQLTSLPESIGELVNLQELCLSDTQLTSLPENLGKLVNLKHLDLSNNQLTSLDLCEKLVSRLREFHWKGNPLDEAEIKRIEKLMNTYL
uniref:leucine-rich repeat domain-containing protein n=1 Tax=uncultured Microscilla sp. TaxID=432653 RepID=UPI002623B4C3